MMSRIVTTSRPEPSITAARTTNSASSQSCPSTISISVGDTEDRADDDQRKDDLGASRALAATRGRRAERRAPWHGRGRARCHGRSPCPLPWDAAIAGGSIGRSRQLSTIRPSAVARAAQSRSRADVGHLGLAIDRGERDQVDHRLGAAGVRRARSRRRRGARRTGTRRRRSRTGCSGSRRPRTSGGCAAWA